MSTFPAFKIMRAARLAMLKLVDDLSVDTLNEIRAPFRNNLIWNMGHIVATTQLRSYARGAGKLPLDSQFIERYQTGTAPQQAATAEEVAAIKSLMLTQLDELEQDYEAGLFASYEGYDSAVYPGLSVGDINDALTFLAFHDGIHFGYMTAIKRVISA